MSCKTESEREREREKEKEGKSKCVCKREREREFNIFYEIDSFEIMNVICENEKQHYYNLLNVTRQISSVSSKAQIVLPKGKLKCDN